MHHLPDDLKPQALAEIRRVIKPGGRLLIVDFKGQLEKQGVVALVKDGWLRADRNRQPVAQYDRICARDVIRITHYVLLPDARDQIDRRAAADKHPHDQQDNRVEHQAVILRLVVLPLPIIDAQPRGQRHCTGDQQDAADDDDRGQAEDLDAAQRGIDRRG